MSLGRYIGWGYGLAGSRPTISAPNPLAGVTQDATSLIYRPQSSAEWAIVQTAAGTSLTPLFGWNCQVASGDTTMSFGDIGLAGVAGGTRAYQQPVTGWTTQCIRLTDNTAGYFRTINALLPDISTTSFTLLAYVSLPASSAGDRTIMQVGAGFTTRVGMDSDASNRIVAIASPNSIVGSTGNWNTVRPVFIIVNRVAGNARVGTNLEVLAPTLAANPTGQEIVWGGDFSDTWNPGAAGLIDLWGFTGDATQADMKAILQSLGWSVAW